MKYSVIILFCFNTCLAQNTIIWEVADTINKKKSFVVGTYHHIGNSFVDSIPLLKKSLLSAELAVFESIDDSQVISEILEKRKRQNQIKKLLTKADYQKLKTISSNWKVDFSRLKPIELLVVLRREFQILKCKTIKTTDTWDHFDNYLMDMAKKNNIALAGLETDSMQLNILHDLQDSWTAEEIQQEISYWISRLTTEESWYEECEATLQYQKFEIKYDFTEECTDDILIKRRNDEWINRLTEIISTKNSFIAVGLLHLKYSCGLLESFRKHGFLVKPLAISNVAQ